MSEKNEKQTYIEQLNSVSLNACGAQKNILSLFIRTIFAKLKITACNSSNHCFDCNIL